MSNYWELTKTLPIKVNQEIVGEFLMSLKILNRINNTIKFYRFFKMIDSHVDMARSQMG